MTNQTTELTNLNPQITAFQNQLRHKYDQENQTAQKGQIVFVGSSLMEIFPIEKMQQQQDWGLNYHIYNRGVRATTTADLLAHMETLIFDLQPSKLFINIGSNDIGFNVPETEFKANYDQILTQIQTRLPQTKIYVMAYYPVNTTADFGEAHEEHAALYEHRSNGRLEQANQLVTKLAAKHQVPFINVNAGLTDQNGDLKPALTFDGAHMLPQGYEIVFQNLLPYLGV